MKFYTDENKHITQLNVGKVLSADNFYARLTP